jgi:lysophospholipase L1-like esterase
MPKSEWKSIAGCGCFYFVIDFIVVTRTTALFAIFVIDVCSLSAQTRYRFDFGSGKVAAGYTQVLPSQKYEASRGYGFEEGSVVERVERGGYVTSAKPFFFSVAVPEGNYRVTVRLGDREGESRTTVKAELRRLMLEGVRTARGQFVTRSFMVHVRRPSIAGGGEVELKDREKTFEAPAWDGKLSLEFNDVAPKVAALVVQRVENVPVIFIAGDSTSTDQPREPYNSWGQMLPRFFKPEVVVANHGESGESLKSFLGARRWDKLLSMAKVGDWVFIQMGHNDQKERGEGIGAFTSYSTDLRRMVNDAKAKGMHPVLVTSVQRRTFDPAGKTITNSLGDYPEAVRRVGRETGVPVIDLNVMSKAFYEALGPEQSIKIFSIPSDATHHNNYGSYQLAKCIVEGIRQGRLGLAKYLVKEVGRFDPGKPDPMEGFGVPASPAGDGIRPEGN